MAFEKRTGMIDLEKLPIEADEITATLGGRAVCVPIDPAPASAGYKNCR